VRPELPTPGAIRAAAAELAALREAARLRAARPLSQPMSAVEIDGNGARARDGGSAPTPDDPLRREIAAAAGTAVHRALERFDLTAEALAELARRAEDLVLDLDPALDPDARAAALARARETLERFGAGPLFPRWLELRGRILARELPLVAAAEPGDDALSFLAGQIDALARGADGRLLVIDYKTDDRVEPERHRGQAARYARALAQALGLDRPPAVELWYLRAGQILELAGPPA
jgi:ATP-dependent exoDNAse (exonuclease V) beta subunit